MEDGRAEEAYMTSKPATFDFLVRWAQVNEPSVVLGSFAGLCMVLSTKAIQYRIPSLLLGRNTIQQLMSRDYIEHLVLDVKTSQNHNLARSLRNR